MNHIRQKSQTPTKSARRLTIVFLCGSLEPGRDGVGDYTRRLAAECIRQGHDALVIALCDREDPLFSDSKCEIEKHQSDQGTAVRCVRWSRNDGWARKTRRLAQILRQESPDVISIQFVPYSFNARGLPFQFLRCFWKCRAVVGGRWHIMFHELWIGPQEGKPLSSRVISRLQRSVVRQLRLCDVVHTHLPVYREALAQCGINASPLPLFSNIARSTQFVGNRAINGVVNIGFFSQQDPVAEVRDWIVTFTEDAEKGGSSVCLHLAGARGSAAESYWRKSLAGKAEVAVHGWMVPEELSVYLRSMDLGITTVPRHAIGKSGSVAAFFEHGTPVAAPVTSVAHPHTGLFIEREHKMVLNSFADLKKFERRPSEEPTKLTSICHEFLNSMYIASSQHIRQPF
ncbi:glycosyltransferase [Stieleria neptunia]|nr:glycosyltransferase [Stieleria neptunia]